jgi:hypothetical protein
MFASWRAVKEYRAIAKLHEFPLTVSLYFSARGAPGFLTLSSVIPGVFFNLMNTLN